MSTIAGIIARNTAAAAGGRCAGRRAAVVGGTSGIGHGCAVALARAGFAVTVVGRREARGAEVVRELAAVSASTPALASAATAAGGVAPPLPSPPPTPPAARPRHVFVRLDASLLRECYVAAPRILGGAPALDALVLTQGIATLQGFTPTAREGLDEKLALHVFSRAALIDALLPALLAAPSPRVLSVLSAGVHAADAAAYAPVLAAGGEALLLARTGDYSLKRAADLAGLYNDVLADELARRHPGAGFVHAAPGMVATNWGTELPLPLRLVVRALQALPFFARSFRDAGEAMCAPLIAAQLPGDALAGVAGAGLPGALLMGADAQPVKRTGAHEAARAPLWGAASEVLARLRTGSA